MNRALWWIGKVTCEAVIVTALAIIFLVLLINLTEAKEWNFTLQGTFNSPTNTHNDDKLEASDEVSPGIVASIGRSLNGYLSLGLRARWDKQRAHGCNNGECRVRKSSINGTFQAFSLMPNLEVQYPHHWLTPYARVAVGGAWAWADTTRSEPGGQRADRSGLVPAYEGAAGLEREINENWAMRLEGGYYYADPIATWFVGPALVVRW